MICKDNRLITLEDCNGCSNSMQCDIPGDTNYPGALCAGVSVLFDFTSEQTTMPAGMSAAGYCLPASVLPFEGAKKGGYYAISGSGEDALSARIGCASPNGAPTVDYYKGTDCTGTSVGAVNMEGCLHTPRKIANENISSYTVCSVNTDWSEWSSCSCDDPAANVRTRTLVGGRQNSQSHPCQLAEPCPGVAEAEPAKVEMILSGDGLWDWVSENKEEFAAALTTDIASTLHIPEEKISNVVASLAKALLLQAHAAANYLLAAQSVDVTFVIQIGASNALTPLQLATAYQSEVANGTANFTSLEATDCPTFTANVTGVGTTVVLGQGMVGIVIIIAVGVCFTILFTCLVRKLINCKAKPKTECSQQIGNDRL
jgi:hypothetical protein